MSDSSRPEGAAHRSLRPLPGLRRTRHRHRPGHRQHPRLCPRPRHRALRAVRRRHRPPHRRSPRRRCRGQAHARPHPRFDQRDPPPKGRCHHRLRGHRADAAPLHPQGQSQQVDPPAGRDLRALRRHRCREAGRRRGHLLGRCPLDRDDRRAHGGGHRRRPAGGRTHRQHDRRHRRRHQRGGRHLAGRHRRLPVPAHRRRRVRRGHHRLRQEAVQAAHRQPDGRGDQARDRLGFTRCPKRNRPRSAAATW